MKLLLKQVVTERKDSTEETVDIAVENGIIRDVGSALDFKADRIIDGEGKLVAFPGLFDMHVHFRDPGLTYKEDIITGAAAAKAGGFTGVACMPNTVPPIDSVDVVNYVKEKAALTGIDVLPIACVSKGMKGKELTDFSELKREGAVAFSDDGRPVENAELMRKAIEQANKAGVTIISHCEDLNIINGGIMNKGEVSKALGVRGMDRASEDYITAREIALAMSMDAHIHIAHVSTVGSCNIIRAAKADGVKVTCETAPHYFTFTDEKLYSKDADYRMSPPLRTEEDRKAVEKAVCDGTIDCIITDHAPHSEEDKSDFYTAPNGVVGLETSLAATLTQLYHTGLLPLYKINEIMSVNPRKILGLEPVSLTKGSVADITVFDPDLEWVVEKEKLHSKSKNSVFKGEKLKGKVLYTISKGEVVFEYK